MNYKKLLVAFVFFAIANSYGQTPTNGGFENGATTWTSTGTTTATNARTGSTALISASSTSTSNTAHTNSTVITVANNSYAHVVAWAIGNNSFSNASVGGTLNVTVNSQTTANIGTTLTRLNPWNVQNTSGSTQNFTCRVNSRTSSAGNATQVYFDDVIMYTDAVATTDLTKPLIATGFTNGTITFSSAGFSWTNGSDANTGIQNTIILRTSNLSAATPVMNDQGVYSTAGGTSGPNIVTTDWTVISTSVASGATTYADATVVPGTIYKYAVIHRDLAYNYSLALVSGNINVPNSSCTAPTTQASNITFSSITAISMDINWTNGNGSGRVVKMNTVNSFTTPASGSLPSASTAWVGPGEQVVYAGTGSGPITITGLTASTTYYYRVYEYCTTGYVYQSAVATNNPLSQATAASGSPTLIAGTLTAFGSQCINTVNGPNSFTLSGTSLDNSAIAIAALSGYSYATTPGGPYTSTLSLTTAGTSYTYGGGTLSGCTIYVKFSPIAVATYGGTITISGGGVSSSIAVTASATDIGVNTPPTISTATSASIGTTTATLGGTIVTTGCSNVTERGIYWSTTAGVVASGGGTNVPETAGAPFSAGAFTEAVTGLPAGTTIYYAAYAINSGGTVYTTQSSFVTLKSEPTNQSTLFACGLTTSYSIPLTWTDASAGILPDGYIIKWSSTSYAAIVDPTDGVAEVPGAGIVNVLQGVRAATATGLTNSTTYYFKIWSFTNGSSSNINYNLVSPQSTSCTTLQPPCLSSNFDSSTAVPAGWSVNNVLSSKSDAGATHYSSAPYCWGLASGANLSTPASNYPTAISFYVDASASGGQIGTLEYSTSGSGGPWTFISNFTATTAGAINTFALTSSPNLSTTANVSFRISSATNTIYIDDLNVYCNITPFITVTPITLSGFTYVFGSGPSASQSFTVSGSNLTTSITLTPPADYEISLLPGSGYGSPIVLSPTAGVVSTTTIYVRLIAGLAAANYNSEVINATSTGATTQTVTCSGSVTAIPVSSITLANNGSQVTAANVAQGTVNQILSTFTLAVGTVDATLTNATIPFNGTYLAADIVASGLQLWYSSTNSFSGATSLGTATSSATGTGENISFASLSQTITVGSTGYFWVTASISASATIGKTINVASLATSNFTFSSAVSSTGSVTTGGVQTISGPLPCLTESFSAGSSPAGWQQTNTAFASFYASMTNTSGSLTTSSVSFPASMTFNLTRSSTNTTNKTLLVEVSTTSQASGFTTLATYIDATTTSGGVTNCTVDLSAYSGVSPVYVRFTKGGTTTSYWYIDDINVYCSPACTPPATPVGTISETPTCGGNSTLSFSGTATAPIVFYWQSIAGGISKINNASGNLTVSSNGSFYVRAYNSATGCWSSALNGPYAVTIGTPQAISTHPANSSITDTSNTTFSVTTTGTVTAYQWQVNTGSGFVNLTNVAPYSNVTTATMTITGATLAMNGYIYQCVVSGVTPCPNVTSNPATLTVNNQKPNNATSVITCYGNTSVSLSWTASTGAVVPDGYLVFALQGATAPAAASPNNASTYIANTDFSLASTVTPASLGKCVYKGSLLSTTITGLLNATNYSFTVVAYKGNTQTGWATGINLAGSWNATNVTITMPNVSAVAATVMSTQSTVSWTRPTPLACYDYLVVANQGAVVFTPTGDGSAYTANATYSSANQVVYKGTGSNVLVTGLTYGLSYCYKVYVRMGTEWSAGVSVCQTTNYCSSVGNTTFLTSVTNVTLNTINNTSAKPSGYSDYTGISTSIQQGVSYPLSMRINTDGNYTVLAFAWIDFNRDGDFEDAGEAFGMGSATNTANGLTTMSPLSIAVPLTASVGSTRMRVIATYDGDTSPCLSGFDGEVEDYTVIITPACIPTHSVVSFTPQSGPTGTDVLITGTGFTASTSVKFNGISATVVFVSSTSIIATVPSGSTTGIITVTEGICPVYTSTSFTQIKQSGVCVSGNNLNNLIISEVYDSLAGNSWYMELYNPTGSSIDLDAAGADYKLVRYGDIGTTNGIRTINISGVIAAGGIYLADLGSDSTCGSLVFNYISKANGINENDEIRLTKNDVTVDIVYCPNEKGYSILRNASATGPSATFNAADWTTNSTESCSNLGIVPFSSFSILPTVNVNPIDVSICGTNASFSVTASSVGTLTYQWYFNDSVATSWTAVASGSLPGVTITGITGTTLNLVGPISTYDKYQFYCQVISNGTCFVASDAAQLLIISTTWNGSVWSNNTPDLSKVAIINGLYDTNLHGDINACSLIVNSGYSATVTPGRYFNIQNDLTVSAGGNLTVENNGSLVMIDDNGVVTNSGTTQIKRTSTSYERYDYVYWSSPVATADANIASTFTGWRTDYSFEFNTANFYDVKTINSGGTVTAVASDSFDDYAPWAWQRYTANMTRGKGYAIMAPTAVSFSPSALGQTVTFSGKVNNGIVPLSLVETSNTDAGYVGVNNANDDYNLVGNPYPSALFANKFITDNGANTSGTLYFWTHVLNVSASNPGPNSYNFISDDYALYNMSGGTRASLTSPASSVPTGYIASGQGFFVEAQSTNSLVFNNSMRSKNYLNNDFFRSSIGANEKDRLWLNLQNADGMFGQQLIAYFDETTLGFDWAYDGRVNLSNNYVSFYSMAGGEKYKIQARPTFDTSDIVPLGYFSAVSGPFTISLDQKEGILNSEATSIYIEDRELNIIHDLKQSPYTFTTNYGRYENRFVLRYTDTALGNPNFETLDSSVVVATNHGEMTIKSYIENIEEVTVYDILGRELFFAKAIDNNNFVTSNISMSQQALIVKIKLENGVIVTRKVIL